MHNIVSWCVTDIFEYVIKYNNNKFTYTKVGNQLSLMSQTSVSSLKTSGESTQEIDGVARNNATT